MRSHRYRLIFWPLFIGSVVLLLANKGASLWWSAVDGVVVALFVLGLVYSSDKTRPYSRSVRAMIMLISMIATTYWLLQMNWVLYIFAPLFLLIVVIVLFQQDMVQWFHRPTSGNTPTRRTGG